MIDRIAKLWASGRSLLEIGKALRLSRGIVAGHIHRARKAGDGPAKAAEGKTASRQTTGGARWQSPRPSRSIAEPAATEASG
jgi:hypothetical protein